MFTVKVLRANVSAINLSSYFSAKNRLIKEVHESVSVSLLHYQNLSQKFYLARLTIVCVSSMLLYTYRHLYE
jgi:hypothetical protein